MPDIIDPFKKQVAQSAIPRPSVQPSGAIIDPFKTPIQRPAAPNETGDFMRGFKTTVPQLKQLAGGSLAYLGDVAGRTDSVVKPLADAARDYGLGVYNENASKAEALSKPSDSFSHVLQNPSEVGSFLKYGAGYTAGQALESLAAAGAGALAGSEVPVAGNIAGAIGGVVAKSSLKKALAEKAAELVSRQVAAGATKEAAEKSGEALIRKALGRRVGGAAGAFGLNETQELGGIYGDARDQADQEGRQFTGTDLARIGGASIGAAGLDTAMEAVNLGKALKGAPEEAATKSALRERAKTIGKEALGGAAREGVTEAAQTEAERFGSGQSLTDSAAGQDVLDSAALGVVGGGLAGGIAGTHGNSAEEQPTTKPGVVSPGISAAEPQQTVDTPPPPNVPFPDAPSSSLADVANTVIAGRAQHAATVAPPTSKEPAPPTAMPETRTEAQPSPPNVPWINQQTGEITQPTDQQIKTLLTDMLDRQFQASGHLRINSQALGELWGVQPNRIKALRKDVLAERRAEPSATPAQTDNPATIAPEPPAVQNSKEDPVSASPESDRTATPEIVQAAQTEPAQNVSTEQVTAPVSPDVAAARPAEAGREKTTMPTDSLSRTASWVIKNKQTGEVLFETFDKAKVDALNTEKYEAVPILEHLQSLNKTANQTNSVEATPIAEKQPNAATANDKTSTLADEARKVKETQAEGARLEQPNEIKNYRGNSVTMREATPIERTTASKEKDVGDTQRNPVGWKLLEMPNGDGAVLVSGDGKKAVTFERKNKRSGTEGRRAIAIAHAFAIDNPYQTEKSEPSNAELVVKPIFDKGESNIHQQPEAQTHTEIQSPLLAHSVGEKISLIKPRNGIDQGIVQSIEKKGGDPVAYHISPIGAPHESYRVPASQVVGAKPPVSDSSTQEAAPTYPKPPYFVHPAIDGRVLVEGNPKTIRLALRAARVKAPGSIATEKGISFPEKLWHDRVASALQPVPVAEGKVSGNLKIDDNQLPDVSKNSVAWKTYQNRTSLTQSLADSNVEFVRSNSKKSAKFIRNGEVLHTVGPDISLAASTKEEAIGLLDQQARQALEQDAASLIDERLKRAAAKEKNARLKARLGVLSKAMHEHGDLIAGAHKNRDLSFKPLQESAFNGKDTTLIHQSSGYSKKRGSTYRLVLVDGEPAYARESDHWGVFYSHEFDIQDMHQKDEKDPASGYWKYHNWTLPGSEKNDGVRRSGYILLKDLAQIPKYTYKKSLKETQKNKNPKAEKPVKEKVAVEAANKKTSAPVEGSAPTASIKDGIPMTDAKALVAEQTKTWGNEQPNVRLLDSPDELPKKAKNHPNYKSAEGFYDGKTVHLVLPNIRSAQRLKEVLAHEAIGHHGVDRIVGEKGWAGIVRDVIRLEQDRIGSDKMRSVLAEVRRRYGQVDDATFTKEVIAVMAEKGIKNGIIDRVVAAVRRYLRAIMPTLRMSESELRQLLVKSDAFLRTGTARLEQAARAQAAFDQPAPVFYSAMLEAIQNAKGAPKQANATVWKEWLDGAARRGEMKQSERDWLGVDQWLDAQPGPISRQDLANFIRENQVSVSEVVKGERWSAEGTNAHEVFFNNKKEAEDFIKAEHEWVNDEAYTVYDHDDSVEVVDASGNRVFSAFKNNNDEWEGGPTYGEESTFDNRDDAVGAAEDFAEKARDEFRDSISKEPKPSGRDGGAKYGEYTIPGGENYREVLLTLPEKKNAPIGGGKSAATMLFERDMMEKYAGETFPSVYGKLNGNEIDKYEMLVREDRNSAKSESMAQDRRNNYKSSHWDQPNVLAHIRFNDRVDADGKKVLHIEEVQSDWHQKGRKEGYADKATEADFRVEKREPNVPKGGDPDDYEPYYRVYHEASGAEYGPSGATSEAEALQKAMRLHRSKGVPDAPLKNTEDWAMLGFKRALRWAAEHGYDKVTWTPGEQQAERYAISKQIDRIQFDEGRKRLWAYKGGSQVINQSGVTRATLPDFIGKEAAAKILEKEPVETRAGDHTYSTQEISGLDLKVGGEGMKGFYDKILPKAVDKYVKKWGSKVTTARLPKSGEFSLSEKGIKEESDTVHAVPITTGMRQSVLSGQPLFSKRDPSATIDAMDSLLANPDGGLWASAKDWAKGAWQDMKPALLGGLTLRHVLELMEPLIPGSTRYSDLVQTMAADRNQLQEEGGALAAEWQEFDRKHKAENKALSQFMHDATVLGLDPSTDYEALRFEDSQGKMQELSRKAISERIKALRGQMRGRAADDKKPMMDKVKYLQGLIPREAKRKATYPALVARWNQFSPAAQDIYRKVRDYYKTHSDRVEQALFERVNALDIPKERKKTVISEIRQQFESQRVEGVYFPLQRFGDYWISAVDKNGDQQFHMFESYKDFSRAEKNAKRMGWTINALGKKDSNYRAKDAPSGTFVSDIIGKLKEAGAPSVVQDQVYQMYLKALPEMSMRRHAIHRKAIAGYSQDALRAFAQNAFHGAHQLARLKYSYRLQDTLDELQQNVDTRRNSKEFDAPTANAVDAMLGELRRRHDWIMNPTDSKIANIVSGIGFAMYLGVTPAAAIVNLTQPLLTTLPVLGGRYGAGKASSALLSAMRDSMRTWGNIDRTFATDDDRQAYAALKARGDIDKTLAHNLAGIADGDKLRADPMYAKVMGGISYLFQRAEIMNREATGMAAFRLARSEGKRFDEAVKYASDVINSTQFDMSNQNRARYMQSGAAKVLLMFRSYALHMSWLIGRTAYKAFKGETQAIRSEARRTMTGMLGMSALFSGAMGLPFMGIASMVMNAIQAALGDKDEPWDFDTEFRNWLSTMIGDDAAKWVAEGPVNQITGADVAGRVSMSNLWFRDADKELEGTDLYYHLLEQAAGPMGGVVKNVLVGKKQIEEGQVWRGVETMLPKALKDGMKSLRFAQQGANTMRGDPLVKDVSTTEDLLQLLGFSPERLAEQYRINNAEKSYEKHILDRKQNLLGAVALATRLQDEDLRAAAYEQIQDFNSKFPEIALTNKAIRSSLRTRAKFSSQAENGVVLNRKLAARIKDNAD